MLGCPWQRYLTKSRKMERLQWEPKKIVVISKEENGTHDGKSNYHCKDSLTGGSMASLPLKNLEVMGGRCYDHI